jgi:hypothetical protein
MKTETLITTIGGGAEIEINYWMDEDEVEISSVYFKNVDIIDTLTDTALEELNEQCAASLSGQSPDHDDYN